MIDQKLRSKGIGASEIGAICGLDPRTDAHDVWARKTGRLKSGGELDPNSRPAWGKRLQEAIVEGYSEITKKKTRFVDETYQNPKLPWQLASPDAFVLGEGGKHFQFPSGLLVMNAIHGCDAKNCSLDQARQYGEGPEDVPDSVSLQCQWSNSTFDVDRWDVAALVGGSNLKVYRIYRDLQLEADILQVGHDFWHDCILKDVEPPIGRTAGAREYLSQRFPKSIEKLRLAKDEELEILERLRIARGRERAAKIEKEIAANAVRLIIGDAEGIRISDTGEKITWKRSKDTWGIDWTAMADDLALLFSAIHEIAKSAYSTPEWLSSSRTEDFDKAMEAAASATPEKLRSAHKIVTREGSRRLRCYFNGNDEEED